MTGCCLNTTGWWQWQCIKEKTFFAIRSLVELVKERLDTVQHDLKQILRLLT